MPALHSGFIRFLLQSTGTTPVFILAWVVHLSSTPAATTSPISDLQSWLHDKALTQDLVHQHLLRARQRMKSQSDRNRTERHFQVHDWVYVNLQPYVQSSLAARSHHKLAFKFFGPYQIVAHSGGAAYKLALPPSSLIHPVFHTSQLKQAVSPSEQVSPTLPAELISHRVPEQVLQRRLVARGRKTVLQVLVQWSGMDATLATWEDYEAVKQLFPRSPAWRQAGSLGWGDVRDATTASPGGTGSGLRRSTRQRGPNSSIRDPQWK